MAIQRLKSSHVAKMLKSKSDIANLVGWRILSRPYKDEKDITWNFILVRVLSDERVNTTCRRARVEIRTTGCDCDVKTHDLEQIANQVDDCIQTTCEQNQFKYGDITVHIAEQLDVFSDYQEKNIPLVLSQFYLYYIV